MDVKMVGIDYQKASVGVRELFSMTSAAAQAAMTRVCEEFGADGCVILSTCGRAERWVSGETALSPYELLCAAKGVEGERYRNYFVQRSGRDAVMHLFQLACGMKSQVFGEDQIITQVGGALALARETHTADAVLENLFRSAVTAAKKVKTGVRLTAKDQSVALRMVDFLRGRLETFQGVPCLVIGNGEMGRLAAAELAKQGCRVFMTLRQYHHGEAQVPAGVETIPYDERISLLKTALVVVSATTSPHYTLRAAEIGTLSHKTVFCDLSVPRDIDPAIARLAGAKVFDTDDICGGFSARGNADSMAKAQALLQEQIAEFESWYGFRTLVPAIREISGLAAEDMTGRVEKTIRHLDIAGEDQTRLTRRIEDAAGKVVGRLLFGLRENLSPELWQSCISGLQKAARGEDCG